MMCKILSPTEESVLRARLKNILAKAEKDLLLTSRERLIVERHFAFNDQSPQRPYETYTSIAKDLQISASRVRQIAERAMRCLRGLPEFRQAINEYLVLFPYLRRGRGQPIWLDEDGMLKPPAPRIEQVGMMDFCSYPEPASD